MTCFTSNTFSDIEIFPRIKESILNVLQKLFVVIFRIKHEAQWDYTKVIDKDNLVLEFNALQLDFQKKNEKDYRFFHFALNNV